MIKNYLYFKNAPSEFFSTQCGDAIGGGATAIYIFFVGCWSRGTHKSSYATLAQWQKFSNLVQKV